MWLDTVKKRAEKVEEWQSGVHFVIPESWLAERWTKKWNSWARYFLQWQPINYSTMSKAFQGSVWFAAWKQQLLFQEPAWMRWFKLNIVKLKHVFKVLQNPRFREKLRDQERYFIYLLYWLDVEATQLQERTLGTHNVFLKNT